MGESSTHIGQYQIRERICGSRCCIYKVWDPASNRTLALKLLPKAAADEDARVRFRLEAQMLERIEHQNIVNVFAAGEDFEGQPYMAMELLHGQTLKDGIKRNNLGPLRNRILLALQLARALEYLHYVAIYHRGLRPEHIFVDHRDKLRLLDIGVSHLASESRYRAPEAGQGEPAPPEDIYSFGVVLYELLGGEPGASATRVPLPVVPRGLQDLIRRCAATSAADRPESFVVIARELEWWLAEPESMPRANFWQRPVVISRKRLPLCAATGLVVLGMGSYFAFLGGYQLGHQVQPAGVNVRERSNR